MREREKKKNENLSKCFESVGVPKYYVFLLPPSVHYFFCLSPFLTLVVVRFSFSSHLLHQLFFLFLSFIFPSFFTKKKLSLKLFHSVSLWPLDLTHNFCSGGSCPHILYSLSPSPSLLILPYFVWFVCEFQISNIYFSFLCFVLFIHVSSPSVLQI